jgi:sec-independent protein translocase protein TatB
MAEFRRASNDFRLQIDEELRAMEREEQQKKREAERAAAPTPSILPPPANAGLPAETSPEPAAGNLQIMPPSLGEQVSAGSPYAVSAPSQLTEEEVHPLLRVDSIPVDPASDGTQPTGMAAAEANAARLTAAPIPETEQAPVHNG